MADLIQFDLASGQRIASAVRVVEGLYSPAKALKFDAVAANNGRRAFRICTFTGDWPKGTDKVVTFKYVPNTPNTALATNLFYPLNPGPTGTKDCAIAREGTAWFLIDVPLATATATFISSTRDVDVVVDVSFDENACEINTEKETVTVADSTTTAVYLKLEL